MLILKFGTKSIKGNKSKNSLLLIFEIIIIDFILF